jgi:succinoglycan biosynthesis transport protein ExoP
MQEMMQEKEINLLEYWNVLWRRKYLLIALFIVFVAVTMVISLFSSKYYKSETLIIASGPESGGLGAALSSLPFAGALGVAGGIQAPADKIMLVLKSRTIAEAVIRKFDLLKVFNAQQWDAVKGSWRNPNKPPLMEDAVKLLNTNISKFSKSKEGAITVSVEWKDPQLAADIANYYVYALTDFLKDKSMSITVQVVDKAIPAENKSRPKIRQNMMLAGVTSLFIGVFLAFFLDYLSNLKKGQ